jgi:spore coat polysaccharide biosynthesis protein SpsF (cytidylyltransferase family)
LTAPRENWARPAFSGQGSRGGDRCCKGRRRSGTASQEAALGGDRLKRFDDVIDGCGFEIISLSALETSHAKGERKHRSELCTLYLRENHDQFSIIRLAAPPELVRRDLRLTVDNPEDLALCRAVYTTFKEQAPQIRVHDIVAFLDANPSLIALTAPFAEQGYKTMYVWGNS